MLTRRELLRQTLGGLAVAAVPLAFPPLPARAAPPLPPAPPRAPRIWLSVNGERVAEAQCMTVSMTQEVVPLYSFTASHPKAFIRGKRGIAGTLVLNNFDHHALSFAVRSGAEPCAVHWVDPDRGSQIRLTGVRFVNEGWGYADRETPMSEIAFTYVAEDLTVIQEGASHPIYEGQFVRPHVLTTGGDRPLRLVA